MTVLVDVRWCRGDHGIARYAREVIARLPESLPVGIGLPPLHPLEQPALWWELWRRRPPRYYTPGFNPPRWTTVPYVFTIHDLVHLRVPEESSPAKRAYYRHVVRPAARRAVAVIACSVHAQHEIAEWAGVSLDRVVVAGGGVSDAFTEPGPRHDPGYAYMLYVGNRKPHKNFDGLLRAYARSGLAPHVKLLMTGNADPASKKIIRATGLEEATIFAGRVEDPDLARLYRGAMALVIPSFYEGFGLPALEAMACGTPVIAADTTSLPEIVGDSGWLVDPRDVVALATSMRELVEDERLRGDLARRGLARARTFTWDAVAATVRNVLMDGS